MGRKINPRAGTGMGTGPSIGPVPVPFPQAFCFLRPQSSLESPSILRTTNDCTTLVLTAALNATVAPRHHHLFFTLPRSPNRLVVPQHHCLAPQCHHRLFCLTVWLPASAVGSQCHTAVRQHHHLCPLPLAQTAVAGQPLVQTAATGQPLSQTAVADGEEVASYHRTSFDDDADVENNDDPVA
ncbi:hypothetical protein Cgig2_021765 [Carnegiea gigantea]|uniref:Uncharacterized protein n=1 Tax=Carnegiea gigantea TaxID=171969 RepID=A0A9Q1GHJ5_9CARY|nr:hypothetical protein Cgig2_021765 [Carnegiea gigantea]